MSNVYHQNVEQILAAASPEQKLMWNDLFLRFGERAAVSQFIWYGILAGSELSTYVARKLFVCYELQINGVDAVNANPGYCRVYNEANVIHMIYSNDAVVYNGAAVQYYPNTMQINNFYCSRLVAAIYTIVKFIGYRFMY